MSCSSRVESIFFEALAAGSPKERDAYLRDACGGDDALRLRVRRLLTAHRKAEGFLDRPAFDRSDLDGAPSTSLDLSVDERKSPQPEARDEADVVLRMLEPPRMPGSLGRLAHYEVTRVLGTGGFGVVVKAFDEKLRRDVAVKILSPILAAVPSYRMRFVREARTAAAVRHENVVAIHAVEDDPIPYLVMEYVPGRTLREKLDASGPLDLIEVLRIGRQAAAGLAAAHARGLVHRDVKPGNILLEAGDAHVKLTDFGLARTADDDSVTRPGHIAGTPLYMAPEQALGHPFDQRADLFSLGSVLYEMCGGETPFQAENSWAVLKRLTETSAPSIRKVVPEIPKWLDDMISSLHARNPADRLGSARKVADLLERRLAELERTVKASSFLAELPSSPPATTPRRPNGVRRGWAAAAIVLATAFGGLGFAESSGVTDFRGTIVRLFSPEGTLVVEIEDPGVSVKVEGADIVIEGAGAKEIRLKAGSYKVEASKDGKLVRRELVDVVGNGRRIVRVGLESRPVDRVEPANDVSRAKVNHVDAAAWERSVSLLPGVERVKAVALRMRELNPGFDGNLATTIEHGVVRTLKFKADHVSDLSPVRVLTGLRSLVCTGSDAFKRQLVNGSPTNLHIGDQVDVKFVSRSGLTDLSPLKGLPLTSLDCCNSNVYDLTPLAGMKLTYLHLGSTQVFDLSPLKGMPLEDIDCAYTRVVDLSPLAGMPLTTANFEGAPASDLSPLKGMALEYLGVPTGVSDLSPLRGMPLRMLQCILNKVSDVSPLKGMRLTLLSLGDTEVRDIEPLRGMTSLKRFLCSDRVADLSPLQGLSLEYLHAGPLVTDLSVLKGMPLHKLDFPTLQEKRDGAFLRSFRTLEIINDLPAAQFWRDLEERSRNR